MVTVTKESLLAADETKSDDETQNDDLVNVTVSVMAGQLARAWVYETMNEVVQFSARRHEHAADASSCAEMVALSPKVSVHVEPERCDDTSVAISILAGQLVRAWLYETMDEVVQFSARRHEHTADASACAVTEAPAPLVVVDDAPPTLSVAPVVVADAELETSDDTIVAVSILAGQLVNAWVYETMGNIIVQRSGEPSESMDNIVQQSTPQHELETHESQGVLQPSLTTDEVLPSNDGTADVESFANDINDASRIVATSVMAGQLVRVWVYDVMDNIVQRSTQQLASPHDVVDDAPLVAIDAPSTGDNLDDNSSEESRDDTVAMSILAGQLVRAWTYDVMDEIVQLTARRHEHAMDATSCAVADTVMADTVMADTVVANAETTDAQTADAEDAILEMIDATTKTASVPSAKVEAPSEEAITAAPSASEMDEINRAVVASVLSGQLVRAWLYTASLSSVAKRLVTDISATPPSFIDPVDASPVAWTQPSQGLYANVARHFHFAVWQPILPLAASADNLSAIADDRDRGATLAMPLDDTVVSEAHVDVVPSISELQRLPVDVSEPLPASELPDVVETLPTVPLWRVDTELSLPIDDAVVASLIAGQLVRGWLHEAVSSVAASACKPSHSTSLIGDAPAVSANENASLIAPRLDTSESHEVSSFYADDPTLCALLSRHLLSAWLTEAMEVTAADAVCADKEISAAFDQAQADSPPVVPSVALPASIPVPPGTPRYGIDAQQGACQD